MRVSASFTAHRLVWDGSASVSLSRGPDGLVSSGGWVGRLAWALYLRRWGFAP